MEKIGFYAGSFDPFTNGHLHVVKVSAKLFDKVIIGIGIAIRKTLQREGLLNVDVISYDNLSFQTAIENNASFLIRGIRNGIDYDFEETLATFNHEMANLDTIYVRAGEVGPINSTMIMDLLRNNADVSKFLPIEIINVVKK